jgi:hypothetical protein
LNELEETTEAELAETSPNETEANVRARITKNTLFTDVPPILTCASIETGEIVADEAPAVERSGSDEGVKSSPCPKLLREGNNRQRREVLRVSREQSENKK